MFTIYKKDLQSIETAIQKEWLETNGLGGWSSSTLIGAHTRRYHGLLVASIVPPTDRMVLLSKLDETIVVNDKRIELGVNCYPGNTIHPHGHQYLEIFHKRIFPQWDYEAEGIRLKKTIGVIHGENTVVITYEVIKSSETFFLELLPLVAARGYHTLAHEGPQMHWNANFENGIFQSQPDGKTNLFISVPGSSFHQEQRWFRNFQYEVERYRGLDHSEDLFNHGLFNVKLKEGDLLGIIISTEDPSGRSAFDLLEFEKERRERLLYDQPNDELTRKLILAGDQFIVKRNIYAADASNVSLLHKNLEGATIIAGYHWFTDWARDTMISLPGLCLTTGRFEDAKKILSAFAASVSMGMLPNRFQDNGDNPEYNNVDGTLWFFVAVYKFLQATNDEQFILKEILPVLKEIIDWHFKGTRYQIRVDEDGLLFAGEAGQQLTWMDARVGNWVVTPRMGKPVEIQALWYNALKIFAELLRLNDQQHDALVVDISAAKAKKSFDQLFWNEDGNYLFDVIDENGVPDPGLRPNQLFAISLPHALIDGDKASCILKIVEEKLYTPVGIRSLTKEDPRYTAAYGGDQWHRDGSYHQGTAWSWLLGPYVDAIMKVKDDKREAKQVLEKFSYHLNEGCIGSVSEIFDADAPHHPRGCIAQAWGVAELMRVIYDHQLAVDKKEEVDTAVNAMA